MRHITLRPRVRRGRSRAAVVGLTGIVAVGLLGLPPATALPADIFELDGNSVEATGGGEDWDTLFGDTTDPAGSSTAFTGIVADIANQSIFTTGGSKDDLDVSSWRHTDGSVPDKDEITNAYAAAYLAPDGTDPGTAQDLILYFGSDRFAQNGSANVGFWFTEQRVAPAAGGVFDGLHETGDTLVLSEFTNGGAVSTIQVWEWDPDATGPTCPSSVDEDDQGCIDNDGTLVLLLASANADCDNAGATANACANVNSGPITVAWDYDAKGGGVQNGLVPAGGFIEGGINLSALRGGEQPCLSSFLAETRSSPAIDATLKDFVRGDFPLCGADISIAPDDVNDVGDPHTFTVHVDALFGGQASPVAGNKPTVTLTDAGGQTITPTSNTCATTGTDANGNCTVTFSSSTATVVTGHAEATVSFGGETFDVSTGSAQGQNPDATKVYVDGRVSIAPDATNGIEEAHTFTVTATQKVGAASSFSAATTGHATVGLTDAGGALNNIDTAASTCDDAGDNLDANGQCTITFTSDTAGTVTGHATVAMDLTTSEGDITITRQTNNANGNSGDAVKTYVDGTITWIKHDDLNALLGGAVFTVCKTERWDSDLAGYVDITDECFDVADDVLVDDPDVTTPDADDDAGEFRLVELTLGTYTITEKTAPEGYALDPDTETVQLNTTTTSGSPTVAFVDPALFKVVILTCNTSTERLVVSQVDEAPGTAGGLKDTLAAGALSPADQAYLCGLEANYDNKPRGTHRYDVTIPKP